MGSMFTKLNYELLLLERFSLVVLFPVRCSLFRYNSPLISKANSINIPERIAMEAGKILNVAL